MGHQEIHGKAAKPQSLVSASYTVLAYPADTLPEAYYGLIFSKWLRSLRFGNDFFKLIDAESYYRAYHPLINRIIHRGDTIVYLAVLTDDHDVVLGFSVSRGKVLDYVYVDRFYRQLGIGRDLVPDGIEMISHVTKTGLIIWANKAGHWKFNPFA